MQYQNAWSKWPELLSGAVSMTAQYSWSYGDSRRGWQGLNPAEESLDQIAIFVEMSIKRALNETMTARWDNRFDPHGKWQGWRNRASDPQHGFDKHAFVRYRTTKIAGLVWQQCRYALKLIIAQTHSTHSDAAQKSGHNHKSSPADRGLVTH